MNIFKFRDINSGYLALVSKILTGPDSYQNIDLPGAGKGKLVNKKSRWHLRNVHIIFENPSSFTEYNVACPKRSKVMNDYMEKEKVLFDEGEIRANVLKDISKIWKAIENEDGTINANYGYMVYHLRDAGSFSKDYPQNSSSFGSRNGSNSMSQWEWCQNRLDNNLETLQAIMHFNRPKDQFVENLDQPCTVFTQFTVEDNKLNFHAYMRSNDIIYGLPYNLAYFQVLQGRMLKYLQKKHPTLGFGYLHYNSTSLHLYHDKKKIAESIVGIKN